MFEKEIYLKKHNVSRIIKRKVAILVIDVLSLCEPVEREISIKRLLF